MSIISQKTALNFRCPRSTFETRVVCAESAATERAYPHPRRHPLANWPPSWPPLRWGPASIPAPPDRLGPWFRCVFTRLSVVVTLLLQLSCAFFCHKWFTCFLAVTIAFYRCRRSRVIFCLWSGRWLSGLCKRSKPFVSVYVWLLYIRSSYCGSASVWFLYPVSECVATSSGAYRIYAVQWIKGSRVKGRAKEIFCCYMRHYFIKYTVQAFREGEYNKKYINQYINVYDINWIFDSHMMHCKRRAGENLI